MSTQSALVPSLKGRIFGIHRRLLKCSCCASPTSVFAEQKGHRSQLFRASFELQQQPRATSPSCFSHDFSLPFPSLSGFICSFIYSPQRSEKGRKHFFLQKTAFFSTLGTKSQSPAAAAAVAAAAAPLGVPIRMAPPAAVHELVEKTLSREKKLNRRLLLLLLAVAGGVYVQWAVRDVNSAIFRSYNFFFPLFLRFFDPLLDAEDAHAWTMWLAAKGWLPVDFDKDWPELSMEYKGLHFPNVVGLAAGYDKNAEAPLSFLKMGFGFIEVGTITPQPQSGNSRPRIFRLKEDHAIINRCGFNSKGAVFAEEKLRDVAVARWKDPLTAKTVLGVNIGQNKKREKSVSLSHNNGMKKMSIASNAADIAAEDVRACIRLIGRFADFLILNVSSPNTAGLRALQRRDSLAALVAAARQELMALDKEEQQKDTNRNNGGLKKKNISSAAAFSPLFPALSPTNAAEWQKDVASSSLSSQSTAPQTKQINAAGLAEASSSSAITTTTTAPAITADGCCGVVSKSAAFYPNQRGQRPLLFVKIAPDLTMEEKREIAEVILREQVDGLVISNTTIQRPESLKSAHKKEIGGLSGAPLKDIATQCVSDLYSLTNGKVFIIATGGVFSGRDALEKIEAGASLVEVYTSMVYEGPRIARKVKEELYALLNARGYRDVAHAVGQRHRPAPKKKAKKPSFD